MSILKTLKSFVSGKGRSSDSNETLKYFSRNDVRNVSEESLFIWAQNKWEEYEKTGPLELLPSKSCFLEKGWYDERSNVYASCYENDAFGDIYEFGLYQSFISSLQQFICAGGEIEVDFFSPEKAKDGAANFVSSVHSTLKVLEAGPLKSHIQSLGLSENITWLNSLEPEYALYRASEEGADYLIKLKSGYLSLFILDDSLTAEDFGL